MTVSTQDEPTIALDAISNYIETYRKLTGEIKSLEDMRGAVRREIERAIGDNTTGTVQGRRTVRLTHSVQRRLSTKAVQAKFSAELLADCWMETKQTRLTLIDGA